MSQPDTTQPDTPHDKATQETDRAPRAQTAEARQPTKPPGMRTRRPNSHDIRHQLARKRREARPIAQLIALTKHYGGPTVRIHTGYARHFHASDAQLISYDHGTLHLEACGACADDAATDILTKLPSHGQETQRIRHGLC
jgi:hypothetical protein